MEQRCCGGAVVTASAVDAKADGDDDGAAPLLIFPPGRIPGGLAPLDPSAPTGVCAPGFANGTMCSNVSVPTLLPFLVNGADAAVIIAPGGGFHGQSIRVFAEHAQHSECGPTCMPRSKDPLAEQQADNAQPRGRTPPCQAGGRGLRTTAVRARPSAPRPRLEHRRDRRGGVAQHPRRFRIRALVPRPGHLWCTRGACRLGCCECWSVASCLAW